MKSPSQLIEERVAEMGDEELTTYTCMDSGMTFEVLGEAQFSPYTGSPNIVSEMEFQQMKDVPPNQKDPMKQVPLQMNPAPAQPGAGSWQTTQLSPNPASDASGTVGADQAGPRGFVAYPQQSMQPGSVPPYQTMSPNQKT